MGFGDELMATGMARGARARGKRVAFGDRRRIIWGPHCAEIFLGNQNIAPPGDETDPDIEWIEHHKGNRQYNSAGGKGWVWNYAFRPTPGEVFFRAAELDRARQVDPGFVLIEPNVPANKPVAVNKQWEWARFQHIADQLRASGHRVLQLDHGRCQTLGGVERAYTPTFRAALAVTARASLVVAHEGGLHHGAAAVGVRAVVIFGGFIPPAVTGYSFHANLAAGGEACGSTRPCEHCRDALNRITVGRVYQAAMEMLDVCPIRTTGEVDQRQRMDARG